MSKEREFLKKLRYASLLENDLRKELEELLAQPEREQEPVAWMQDSVELYVLEEKSVIRGYVIPLYTSPPKREPLGLEIMDVCGSEDYREGFKDGALYAEKCHDIVGE